MSRLKLMIMKFIVTLLTVCFALSTQAQSYQPFERISDSDVRLQQPLFRGFFPEVFDVLRTDALALQLHLDAAPWENTAGVAEQTCLLELPLPGGGTEVFHVWRTAMIDESLAAAAPYLRTYAGQSVRDRRFTVRFSYTARGFRAALMYPDLSCAFIEPYSWNQVRYYLVYHQQHAPVQPLRSLRREWVPDGGGTHGLTHREAPYVPAADDRGVLLNPVKLKVYRYVVATTGEFSEDHGGTKPLVLSAVTEYSNIVSGFFERDIALRLQLIGGTQNVIFLNPATDPYTGVEVGDWMAQNPAVVNQYANPNSHDVGHVYARYITGGAIGVAGGITCGDSKARGCSAGNGSGDYGDFFLNVIGQEVGHQMSGGHSWNRCNGGGGRAGLTAFEPGSGSTIMSYAGACGPDNIQGYSDLYYHAGSIEEIQNFYTYNAGTECGTFQTVVNQKPVVTIPYQDNFFIPISTPFELTGTGTDPDGDALVYTWEEVDAGPETPLGSPVANAATFRTWPAVMQANRYFPRLSVILANGFSAAEQLPTYTRDLTFRLAARDNVPGGGGVGWEDVAFKSWEGAGPFLVTHPNTNAVSWKVGEYAQVTWDVANTDQSPVNCNLVNIRLSTDGGLTYPITLAQGVENDGSQYVLVPNNITNTARVRVDAADNVFFDISNTSFKIIAPTQPSFTFGLSGDYARICLPDVFETDILSAGVLGFSEQVTLSVEGNLPPGATVSFSSNPILPGQPCTFTMDLGMVGLPGDFNFEIRAALSGGGSPIVRPVSLTLLRNDFSGLGLDSPSDGSTNLGLTQILYWNKGLDASSHDLQLSKSPDFDVLISSKSATTADTFKVPLLLEKGTAYYWRVRPRNSCGEAGWTEPFFFSTFAEDCSINQANDLPKVISANSTPTVETKIVVGSQGVIADINLKKLKGYHEFFKDLNARLVSPSGQEVVLFADKCANYNGSFDFGLDDAAPGVFLCPPPNNGNAMRPQNPLAPFTGQSPAGTWTLRVKDNVIGSGGSINAFLLEICNTADVQPPFVVNNQVLTLQSGTNSVISSTFLKVDDLDNPADQLTFTVVTAPVDGLLDKLGVGSLSAGDQFTQADINNGAMRFFDYGGSNADDGFRFVVTDGDGGFLGTPRFVVNTFTSATDDIRAGQLPFDVFPNPGIDLVQVQLEEPSLGRGFVELWDVSGRLVARWSVSAGTDRMSIRTADLPRGQYILRLETSDAAGVRRLVLH
jgi:subtilisin-like proprotein convertase family protein